MPQCKHELRRRGGILYCIREKHAAGPHSYVTGPEPDDYIAQLERENAHLRGEVTALRDHHRLWECSCGRALPPGEPIGAIGSQEGDK